jgi:tol-pal system protein YbgF
MSEKDDSMIRYTALVLGLTLVGVAPAAAQDRVHQQMMGDIRMLQEQQQQLQQMLGMLGDTLRTLNAKLDEQANATRKASADQKLVVDNMAEGVRILREKADDTSVRISTLTQELEMLRQALASAQFQASQPPGGDPTAGGLPPAAGAPLPVGVSVERQYELSYGDYVTGSYDLAISGFEEFIRQYPASPLADDAQLNIGNSYLNSGRYKEAVTAFQRVITEYPDSDSVPAAFVRLGMAHQSLNQPDAARKAWETVIERYPNSNEATLASQALERLKRK